MNSQELIQKIKSTPIDQLKDILPSLNNDVHLHDLIRAMPYVPITHAQVMLEYIMTDLPEITLFDITAIMLNFEPDRDAADPTYNVVVENTIDHVNDVVRMMIEGLTVNEMRDITVLLNAGLEEHRRLLDDIRREVVEDTNVIDLLTEGKIAEAVEEYYRADAIGEATTDLPEMFESVDLINVRLLAIEILRAFRDDYQVLATMITNMPPDRAQIVYDALVDFGIHPSDIARAAYIGTFNDIYDSDTHGHRLIIDYVRAHDMDLLNEILLELERRDEGHDFLIRYIRRQMPEHLN